jgi:hypothetical protein
MLKVPFVTVFVPEAPVNVAAAAVKENVPDALVAVNAVSTTVPSENSALLAHC